MTATVDTARKNNQQPGSRLETGLFAEDLDVTPEQMIASTDRYWSPEFQALEAVQLWSKVWQIAGRVDEIPNPGDWFEYRVLDQSYVVVRGDDNRVRAFVNACRHRGNILCQGRGNSSVLVCPFHMWQYNLDGTLRNATDEQTFCAFDHR